MTSTFFPLLKLTVYTVKLIVFQIFELMIYQEIDIKNYFANLPPIHVPHPQYWRKGVYTEAWLSEEEQSCNRNQAFWVV